MATRNIVPRADGEGSLGTTLKRWLSGFFNWLNISQYIDVKNSSNPSHEEGRVFYDNIHKTLCYYNDNNEVTLNIGQENIIRVYNNTGSEISDGKVVYIDGCYSNEHPFPTIKLAKADNMITARAIGITTCNIANGEYGYVNTGGEIHGLDLSEFEEGAVVYLSDSEAGALTTEAPAITIRMGFIIHAGTGASGILLVSIQEFGESVGDMLTSTYDVNENGIVDKAEALNDGSTGDENNCPASEVRDHLDDLVTDRKHLTDEQNTLIDELNNFSTGNRIITSDDLDNGYNNSLGESTTTSEIYQEKVKLSFTPVSAGDYILQWSIELANSSSNQTVLVRIQQDDSINLNEIEFGHNRGNAYDNRAGLIRVSLDDSSHTFDIDFSIGTGGTAKIRRARLLIRRIP